MLFARVVLANGSIGTRTCSGGYFAPRVVATAAHCLPWTSSPVNSSSITATPSMPISRC